MSQRTHSPVTRPLVLVVVAVLISGSLLMTFNGFRRVFRGGSDDADLPPPYDPAGKKLRILCLHGYHGSAATMRRQASGATALLAPYADLFFLDAPSRSHGDFGWWHATSNRAIVYEGWEATRRGVKLAWDTQGPFDGVLGFSQGAVLASLLVALPEFPFEFAIMAGGFAARDPRLAALYERNKEKYAIPSLHIYGRADGIVDPRASAALSDKFVNPTTIVHDGGHVIAASGSVAQKIWTTFIKERWGAKYSDRKAAGKGAQAPYVAAQVSNATHGTSGYQPRALMVPGPGVFPTGRSGTVPVKLWPNETASRMRVTFPTASGPGTRWAVVIFRGGAYSTPRGSGGEAARWASKRGFVAAEVDYGTAMIGAAGAFPHNVWDGQRAVRLVRANARAWGVQPNRIVLMGFSAGAHLAAVVSVGKNIPQTPEADDLAHVCARPNAVVLAYGVLSFVDGYRPGAYLSTVDNFFGGSKKHDQALRDKFSPDLTVGRDCPPAFVWTLRRDSIVPYTHSTRFAAAAKKAGVTVELRVYEQGGHGVGMAEGSGLDCEKWPKEWLEWMATLE